MRARDACKLVAALALTCTVHAHAGTAKHAAAADDVGALAAFVEVCRPLLQTSGVRDAASDGTARLPEWRGTCARLLHEAATALSAHDHVLAEPGSRAEVLLSLCGGFVGVGEGP